MPSTQVNPSPRPLRFLFILSVSALACSSLQAADPSPSIDFKSSIEPLFVKRCSECHGPDSQKAKFRLDLKADAFKGGKSGKPGIVPGKGSESEILSRIASQNPDLVMPPKGEKLSPKEIASVRSWIDQGASWPDEDPKKHWAFLKPNRPSPPKTKSNSWPKNDIDRFILHRIEQAGLSPSLEADKRTLLRRLSLDLTGLPPTLAEIERFEKDRSPEAYEQLVDRLLSSPHYGENAARSWLDAARYADSNGYQVDLARSIWPYRDWVINAFNANQPFDQFTIEQLAGDLLPHASLQQRIATGFNRNTKINDEGGGDAEEYRTKAVKDRVATTATTWLGLTMMCAECHTHKYDPITHEEYYRFYAFFNNTTDGGNYSVEPTVPVPAPNLQPRTSELRSQITRLQSELATEESLLPSEQIKWEKTMLESLPIWIPLSLTNAISTGGASYETQSDQSILAKGVNPTYDTITVESVTSLQGITAVRLEVLPDPSLPKNGPGRWSQTGNFILDEMSLWATPVDPAPTPNNLNTNLFFASAVADWEQTYYTAEHAVDRNPKTGWAIGPQFAKPHFLIAELRAPLTLPTPLKLGFRFEHYHGNNHSLGRFRLSVTNEKDPARRWPIPTEISSVLSIPKDQRSPEQSKALASHFRSRSSKIRSLERQLFRLNQRENDLASTRFTTLVMAERNEPRTTYIHSRGNFLDKGNEVSPGVPAVFPPLPSHLPPNRLALAQWLVSPENPLTARVTVNRLWERFFGTGIVKTSEDFGRQGDLPSHPELLDWLATEFIHSGWNLKALQKTIVMSATYRQSPVTDARKLEKDAYNRLLSHGPRFRLDGEVIRDVALSASGLLNPRMGGPSVFPTQVPNLWKEIGFLRPEIGMDEWPESTGNDLYRRAVYTFWRRVCTYPTFATFDAPSRDVCIARRPRTNTPLQALAALNDVTFVEAARVFAQRVLLSSAKSVEARVDYAFQLCVTRKPTNAERDRLVSLYRQQLASFKTDPASALALISNGPALQPPGLDPHELAAWTILANVLLNLDETLTKG